MKKSKQVDTIGRVLSIRVPNTLLMGCYDICELYNLRCASSLSSWILETIRFTIRQQQDLDRIPVYTNDKEAGELLNLRTDTGHIWESPVSKANGANRDFHPGKNFGFNQQPSLTNPSLVKQFSTFSEKPCDLKDDSFAPDLYDLSSEFGETPDFAVGNVTQNASTEFLLNNSIETNEDEKNFDFYNEDEQALFEQLMNEEIGRIQQQEQEDLLSKILVTSKEKRPPVTSSGLINTSHNVSLKLYPLNTTLENDKFFKTAKDNLTKKAIRLVYCALPFDDWSTEKASLLIEKTILSLISMASKDVTNEP